VRIETILGAQSGAVKQKPVWQGIIIGLFWLITGGCRPQQLQQQPKPQASRPKPAHYRDARTGREAYAVPRTASPLFNPQLAPKLLDDPKRDTWQKPEQIVRALRLQQGDVVADIGAGSGYLLPHLSRAVGPQGLVLAEEIQPEYFPALHRHAKRLKNVRVIRGTTHDPKLIKKVNCFVLLTTYHEVENPVAFLKTLKRYAKSGAHLAIIDFDASRKGTPTAPQGHEIADVVVIAEAKAAGWRLVKQHQFLSSQFFLVFESIVN
jgi:SAM-dependent methyltransferase